MKKNNLISIIMPTYNEAGNIEEVIIRTSKTIKKNLEIIVVDDNSPDGTAQTVKRLQKGKSFLKLISRKKGPRSLPLSIKKGIKEARGEIIGWLDCDLSMPPEKFVQMIKALKNNDIVIGSTFIDGAGDGRNLKHAQFFSWLINKISRLFLGNDLTDYTSGFILARRAAIEKTNFDGVHGAYFIDLICQARKNGYQIAEVPYTLYPRYSGETKIAGWSYIRSGLIYLRLLLRARLKYC